MERFQIVVWHGEHKTLFYVVDTEAVHEPSWPYNQQCIIETWSTREGAERGAKFHNYLERSKRVED